MFLCPFPGENLADAALREVLEETGVKTEFEFLLTFRHMHGAMFGCSDCYFVVSLKPTSEEINMCPREIAACQWMKVDDYLNSPHTIETNKFFVKKYLECQKSGTGVTYESSVHPFLKRRFLISGGISSKLSVTRSLVPPTSCVYKRVQAYPIAACVPHPRPGISPHKRRHMTAELYNIFLLLILNNAGGRTTGRLRVTLASSPFHSTAANVSLLHLKQSSSTLDSFWLDDDSPVSNHHQHCPGIKPLGYGMKISITPLG
uniref:(California timema) hypothetical protein n=1 Tax=Timema californicum TaxID=61474 RepID=A0A7R9P7B8_TIMCA|nr:unnamed protein product [Timema californicum]